MSIVDTTRERKADRKIPVVDSNRESERDRTYLTLTRPDRQGYRSGYSYRVGDLEYRDRVTCERRAELADRLAEEATDPSRRAMFLGWATTWRAPLLDATR